MLLQHNQLASLLRRFHGTAPPRATVLTLPAHRRPFQTAPPPHGHGPRLTNRAKTAPTQRVGRHLRRRLSAPARTGWPDAPGITLGPAGAPTSGTVHATLDDLAQ